MAYYKPNISVGNTVVLNKDYQDIKKGNKGVVKAVNLVDENLTEYATIVFSTGVRAIPFKLLKKANNATSCIKYDDLFE